MVIIRKEQPDDIAKVHVINEVAFGQPAEAGIVDSIRATCGDSISLVAVDAGVDVDSDTVIGHIFFSPVVVTTASGTIQGMGLAPVAVLPQRQREGIGSSLVEAGIGVIRKRGVPFIMVLGHPEYYPRFGFVPASRHGLSCQWDGVPDEAFMVLVLDDSAMSGVSGTASYRDEFDRAM